MKELAQISSLLFLVLLAGCKQEPQNDPVPKDDRQGLVQEVNNPASKTDAEARKIIADAVQAHGGKAKIMTLQVAHVKYSSSMTILGKQGHIDVDLYFQSPDRLRKVTRGTHGSERIDLISVVNGRNHWYRTGNGEAGIADPVNVRETYRPHLIIEQLVSGLEEGETILTNIGKREIDGRILVGVRMKRPGREQTDLFFDPESGLLTATQHKRVLPGNLKESLQEAFVSDYKVINGLTLFHLQSQKQDGVETAEVRIIQIQTFDKFDDNIFAQP